MLPLNVAVVGCGAVAELYHAPALRQLQQLNQMQVQALVDPSTAQLRKFKQIFPGSVGVANVSDLADLDIDLAIVASPPIYHASQALQLLEAGVHVLCEKPMAVSVAEAQAMAAAAKAHNRLLAIGLMRRFLPATGAIRQILAENVLGRVKFFQCSEGDLFRWPAQTAPFM